MKKTLPYPMVFFAALLMTALTFTLNLPARADDHDDRNGEQEHEHDGAGQMNAVVMLTATTNAPAGARGVARIEAEEDDDDQAASMELKLVGLNAGEYLLSVTRQSDGTNVWLGSLTIRDSAGQTNCVGRHEDEDEEGDHDGEHQGRWDHDDHWIGCNWGGFTNWGSWTNWSITNWCNASNRATAVEAELKLPAGLDPLDIGQVQLWDTNGVLILAGDLVKPAPATVINIRTSARVIAGPGAPAASGVAQVQSTAVKGKWKHQFTLQASGFEAKNSFRIYANGKKVSATRSDKTGQVQLKKLPPKLPAIRSVRLLDAQGNEAARVQF